MTLGGCGAISRRSERILSNSVRSNVMHIRAPPDVNLRSSSTAGGVSATGKCTHRTGDGLPSTESPVASISRHKGPFRCIGQDSARIFGLIGGWDHGISLRCRRSVFSPRLANSKRCRPASHARNALLDRSVDLVGDVARNPGSAVQVVHGSVRSPPAELIARRVSGAA